jgi:hypothetical protein
MTERMTSEVRPSRMRYQRQARGLAVAGLLCAALAGCGSVVASTPGSTSPASPAAGAGTTGATADGASAAGASAAAAPLVGCASANEATSVTVRRMIHLVEPVNSHGLTITVRKPALVRALFRDLCAAVAHPVDSRTVIRCPADFGTDYLGTFYDTGRVLATFTYAAGGCQPTTLTAAGKTRSTVIFGSAATAAPHLDADMAAVLGLKLSELQSPTQINQGGPNKSA